MAGAATGLSDLIAVLALVVSILAPLLQRWLDYRRGRLREFLFAYDQENAIDAMNRLADLRKAESLYRLRHWRRLRRWVRKIFGAR